jgi:hypothetical protein
MTFTFSSAPTAPLRTLYFQVLVCGLICVAKLACTTPHSPTSQPSSTPRVVAFQPGIRIDYRVPQVEVDGEVILREGPLELFAYAKAPTPKEHESIVLLRSPPEAIFQALGLIGLVPGHPMRYYPETGKTRLPTGDRVEVFIRYERVGEPVEESACAWMMDVGKKQPMAHTHWLFTGSERLSDGALAANIEGTVVTVVDFPSALLALPAPHTAADADLWLSANTSAIPPLGTKVVLILRPVRGPAATQHSTGR